MCEQNLEYPLACVIAPTHFLNKCSSTEFAGSRTASLGATSFQHVCLSHCTTLSIFHLSDLNTKTRGFRVLVISYIRKKSDIWMVILNLNLLLFNRSGDKVYRFYSNKVEMYV